MLNRIKYLLGLQVEVHWGPGRVMIQQMNRRKTTEIIPYSDMILERRGSNLILKSRRSGGHYHIHPREEVRNALIRYSGIHLPFIETLFKK